MVSAIVSALHVLALALRPPSMYLRGQALKGRLDKDGLLEMGLVVLIVFVASFTARGFGLR